MNLSSMEKIAQILNSFLLITTQIDVLIIFFTINANDGKIPFKTRGSINKKTGLSNIFLKVFPSILYYLFYCSD